jgi:hypothetical protein
MQNQSQIKNTTTKVNKLGTTVKLGYNELGYNEHSVITNKILVKIGHFSTKMNPVVTNKYGRSELFVITEFDYQTTRVWYQKIFFP